MKFDEKTLLEIEEHVQSLDESVGLSPKTITDIASAIFKHRKKLKTLNIPIVVGQSEQLKFLIEKFQTPKGNYIIDLLMEFNEAKKL